MAKQVSCRVYQCPQFGLTVNPYITNTTEARTQKGE
jgi:hypothetical protein